MTTRPQVALDPPDWRRDPLDRLWQALSSPVASWVLLVLVAGALLIAALIPQLPADVRGDPESAARWVAEREALLGSIGASAGWAGLFDLFNAAGFRLLISACALCLALGIDRGVRSALALRRGGDPSYSGRVRETLTALPPAVLAAALERRLAADGLRVRTAEQDSAWTIQATKRTWAAWFSPAAHLGLLIAVLSLAITARWGWREAAVSLLPGSAHSLDQRAGWAIQVDTLEDADVGSSAGISLRGPDAMIVQSSSVSLGRPMLTRGLTVHLLGTGPALRVIGADEGNKPLLLQAPDSPAPSAVLDLIFAGQDAERFFAVPDRNLSFRVVYYPRLEEPQLAGPAFLVQVYQGAAVDPVFSELVQADRRVTLGQDSFRLAVVRYASLDVVADPGAPALWLGLMVAAVAFGAGQVCRAHWLSARLAPLDGGSVLESVGSPEPRRILDECTALADSVPKAST